VNALEKCSFGNEAEVENGLNFKIWFEEEWDGENDEEEWEVFREVGDAAEIEHGWGVGIGLVAKGFFFFLLRFSLFFLFALFIGEGAEGDDFVFVFGVFCHD